jgi:hypothetical protein
METWGQWFRRRIDEAWEFGASHFNILLLFSWVVFMLFYVLHVSHHENDAEMLNWSREVTAGVIGALLGMLTGMGMNLAHQNTVKPPSLPPPVSGLSTDGKGIA